MRDVTNCDMACEIVLGNDVNYHSKVWVHDGSDFNNIIIAHESNASPVCYCDPPFVLLGCDALSSQT